MSPTAEETDDGVALHSMAHPGSKDLSPESLEEIEADIQVPGFEGGEEGSPMGEHIMQRLRYFENLAEHQAAHIATLGALLTTHGVATPAMPHFPELKSPVGNHDPN